MASVTDDPKKAIAYVRIFLPGFITLGFVSYVTGIYLSEFTFAYLAVALSLLIYATARAGEKLAGMLRQRSPQVKSEASTAVKKGRKKDTPPSALALSIWTVVFSFIFVLLIELQIAVAAVHFFFPTIVLQNSTRTPLVELIHADANGKLGLDKDHDERDAPFRIASNGRNKFEPYKLFARVQLSDSLIYEGRIFQYDTTKANDAFPVVLSPACRVIKSDTPDGEQFVRIWGPGVYISGKDLKSMELYEAKASQCFKCFDFDNKYQRPGSPCRDALPAALLPGQR